MGDPSNVDVEDSIIFFTVSSEIDGASNVVTKQSTVDENDDGIPVGNIDEITGVMEEDTLVDGNMEVVTSDITNPKTVKAFGTLSNDEVESDSLADDLENSDLFLGGNRKEECGLGCHWAKVSVTSILIDEDRGFAV